MLGHDTRFQPGQSGNPGGRKPIPEELKNRLRNLSEKAVDALEQALDSKDDRVRIHAATVLLDRAYGKPAQQHDVDVKQVDFAQAHLAALVESPNVNVSVLKRRGTQTQQQPGPRSFSMAVAAPPYPRTTLTGGLGSKPPSRPSSIWKRAACGRQHDGR